MFQPNDWHCADCLQNFVLTIAIPSEAEPARADSTSAYVIGCNVSTMNSRTTAERMSTKSLGFFYTPSAAPVSA